MNVRTLEIDIFVKSLKQVIALRLGGITIFQLKGDDSCMLFCWVGSLLSFHVENLSCEIKRVRSLEATNRDVYPGLNVH